MSNTYSLPKQGLGKAKVLRGLDDALAKEPDKLRGNMSCYCMKGTEELFGVVSDKKLLWGLMALKYRCDVDD